MSTRKLMKLIFSTNDVDEDFIEANQEEDVKRKEQKTQIDIEKLWFIIWGTIKNCIK